MLHSRCRQTRTPAPARRLLPTAQPQHTRRSVAAYGVVPVAERNGWWLKQPQPNLLTADGLESVVTVLQENTDKLVLLEFFAPWCASCKALYPKLSKLCAANPQIVVVKVNFEEHKDLAKKLGVKVLPFFHAYHGSMGRVAAFSSSITKIQRLKDCIELFGNEYCDIDSHKGIIDVSKSLPEFKHLPTPSDATVLKFAADGSYDETASIAAKESQGRAAVAQQEPVQEAAPA